MGMKGLAHIAIYTKDIDASIAYYQNIGFTLVAESQPDVRLAFLSLGNCVIELVEFMNTLPKEGVIPHIAIECSDIEDTVVTLKAKGIIPVLSEVIYNPKILTGVKNIFFSGPSGENLELFEEVG